MRNKDGVIEEDLNYFFFHYLESYILVKKWFEWTLKYGDVEWGYRDIETLRGGVVELSNHSIPVMGMIKSYHVFN